eukprot:9014890-Pyramimonas_sp.AAC.1
MADRRAGPRKGSRPPLGREGAGCRGPPHPRRERARREGARRGRPKGYRARRALERGGGQCGRG